MVGSIIRGVDGSASAQGAARLARGPSGEPGMRLVFVDVDSGAQWLVEIRMVSDDRRPHAHAGRGVTNAGGIVRFDLGSHGA